MKKIYLLAMVCIVVIVGVGIYTLGNRQQPKQESVSLPSVNIGMVTFPGYAPLYVAKEKGFFEGVNVELTRIESIGDIRAAMRSGDINMYAATYDIYQSTKDVPPTGVGFVVIDESHGADGVAVAEDIMSVKDLRDKDVGAEPGFPPYLILQYILDAEGMTVADVNFHDLPTTDAGNAFVAGKLVGAGVYEPALSASVEARSGARVLASSADIPGLIQDLLFADETLTREHPEVLRSVAEGYFRALDYIETNHDDAYRIMAKAFGVSTEEMEDFQTGVSWINKTQNKELFDADAPVNVYKTYDRVCNILKKNGDTTMCLPSENILTHEIIASIS